MPLCASVYLCLVVTCWERADLLAPFVVYNSEFVTFPFGILGQVWYLIVSIPDLCIRTYFGQLRVIVAFLYHTHLLSRSYSGFNLFHQSDTRLTELKQQLGTRYPYDNSVYYTAGYDSPFTFSNRHNEVWLAVKDGSPETIVG